MKKPIKDAGNRRKQDETRDAVRKGYAAVAKTAGSCCGPSSSCCGSGNADSVARAVGYTGAELSTLPEGANMGLSCGNPGAIAALKPGETVLDLGSGGGFDVFLAAQKVGTKGRVIGVDMTPEMVAKARRNAESFRKRTKLDNVEFRLGEIENLPAADASADAVMSNCVINLSPDKPRVWREAFRVLKPGGRVAVSDIALLRPLPPAVRESIEALVGCVAGAATVSAMRRMLLAAGFTGISLKGKPVYVESMVERNDPLYRKICGHLPRGRKIGDYVTSLDISAWKPLSKKRRKST